MNPSPVSVQAKAHQRARVYGDVCRGHVAEQVAEAKTGQDEAVAADPEMVAVCDGERDGNGEGWPSEVEEPAWDYRITQDDALGNGAPGVGCRRCA